MAVLSWFFYIILIVPPSMFIHEMGHACLASLRGVSRVDVGIGFGKEIFTFRLKTVYIHVCLFFLFGAYASYSSEDELTYGDQAFISLGGPLFSLAAAWLCWWGFYEFRYNLFFTIMLFNGWIAIINLLPYKWRGKKSDGYVFIEALLCKARENNH